MGALWERLQRDSRQHFKGINAEVYGRNHLRTDVQDQRASILTQERVRCKNGNVFQQQASR